MRLLRFFAARKEIAAKSRLRMNRVINNEDVAKLYEDCNSLRGFRKIVQNGRNEGLSTLARRCTLVHRG